MKVIFASSLIFIMYVTLSGCAPFISGLGGIGFGSIGEATAGLVLDKVEARARWQATDDLLTKQIISTLFIAGMEKASKGDLDGAEKLWERARAVHNESKPLFMIEKVVKRIKEKRDIDE